MQIDEIIIPIRPKLLAPLFFDLNPRRIPVIPKTGGKKKREIAAHIREEIPSIIPGCLSGSSAGTLAYCDLFCRISSLF